MDVQFLQAFASNVPVGHFWGSWTADINFSVFKSVSKSHCERDYLCCRQGILLESLTGRQLIIRW